MKCVLYVLYSKKCDKYYIGHTNNIERRLCEHNDVNHKGWTRYHQPWSLVYTEKSIDRSDAMRKEKYLKSLKSRKRIEKYIAGWRSGTSRGS